MKALFKIVLLFFLASIIGLILLLWIRHTNYFPQKVIINSKSYHILKKIHDETINYEIVQDDNSELFFKFSGSTDLLCDDPLLLKYDVDQDGYKDLYFASCGGHEYYRVKGINAPELIDLGQYEGGPDSLSSWYFNWLRTGFSREIIMCIVIMVISFILLVIIKRIKLSSEN